MDIASLSMAMAMQKTAVAVNVAVMKNQLEMMEQTGNQISEMLQTTAVQSNIDIKV